MNIIKVHGGGATMLYVIRAKACPRCSGDLSLECDIYGTYIQCIQCGATFNRHDVNLYRPGIIENSLKAIPGKKSAIPPQGATSSREDCQRAWRPSVSKP